jgi:type III pantothenate kinase
MLADEFCCADGFTDFLENRFGADLWGRLDGCVISSVVPQKKAVIVQALREKNAGLSIQSVDTKKCALDFSRYEGVLGEDRIVCCEAAFAKYNTPLIVIDLGSATTVNVIDANKVFLGGAIHTGVKMGLQALNSQTAQLPLPEEPKAVELIGGGTRACLASGAVYGAAFLIEGYVSRISGVLNCRPGVVITGGNAYAVMPFLTIEYAYEPSLLLEGLALHYRRECV